VRLTAPWWVAPALLAACSDAPEPRRVATFSVAQRVELPFESGSFVLDLWLQGESKMQIASSGTGAVSVDAEFEDGDRRFVDEWTLVGEVQIRPLHLPGAGSRPLRLHFEASPYVRWERARLLRPTPEPEPARRPELAGALAGRSVVVVACDPLPAGACSDPDLTELAGLADRGVRFEHAYAQSSSLLPSTMSLLTSLEQELHGVVAADRALEPQRETLARRFQEAGYATVALVQATGLDPACGLDRGFDEWRPFRSGPVESDLLVRAAEQELDAAGDEPRFLYVHASAGASDDEGLRELDARIGRLARHPLVGEGDDVVLVLLGVRGSSRDSNDVSEAALRVPLVIVAPDSGIAPGRVEEPVSLLDVGPTLCELVAVGEPKLGRGRALTAWLEGTEPEWPERRFHLSGDYREGRPSTALVFEGYKYVARWTPDSRRDLLFDLERDSTESNDLSTANEVRAGALEYVATTWWKATRLAKTLEPVLGLGRRADDGE